MAAIWMSAACGGAIEATRAPVNEGFAEEK
jgi:hypothetical protein